MIVKKHISRTLKDLDDRYNGAMNCSSIDESIYYSKLAILEYCGWIEEAFDNIVRRSVKNRLKSQPYRQMLETSVIGNNHGFQYKENFRPMLTRAIGLVAMEKVEKELDKNGNLSVLISELEAVKRDRDSAAHTWALNATRTYPSPSITRARLERIYPIAKGIYSHITKL